MIKELERVVTVELRPVRVIVVSYPKVIAVAATTGSPFRPRDRRLSAEHRVQSRQQ